jgi:hypothetical protein
MGALMDDGREAPPLRAMPTLELQEPLTLSLPKWLRQLLIGLAFALCLWMIDWEGLRGAPFEDIYTYLDAFTNRQYSLDPTGTWIEWYTQEYLWRLGIYWLAERYPIESLFSFLTFASLAASAVFVAVRARSPLYLAILVNPLVIDLAFSQVRSAVAMALVWIALLLPRIPRIALLLAAPFVHSAVGIYSAVLLIPWDWSFIRRRAALVAVVVFIGAAFTLGPLRSEILEGIGDRRALIETESSGVLFTLMLCAYALPFVRLLRDRMAFLVTLSSILCLVTYLFAANGNRFVAMTMPALAVALSHIPGTNLRRWSVAGVIASSLVYFVFYWTA